MARRNPPHRVNNIPYMFYLSEEQMKFIREQSKKEGMSQAEYCRGLVAGAMARVGFYDFIGQKFAKAVADDRLAYEAEQRASSGTVMLAHANDKIVQEFQSMYKQAIEERMPEKHDDSADALSYVVGHNNPLANQSQTMVKSVTHGHICDTMKTGEE